MTRVKICGLTRLQDAFTAAEAGADFVGFVFAPSPRRADPAATRALSIALDDAFPHLGRVAVFVHPRRDEVVETVEQAHCTHAQIHGPVPDGLPESLPVIAVQALGAPEDAVLPERGRWGLLVEPKVEERTGGTGQVFPWAWARPLLAHPRLFLAGGLDAERVIALLGVLRPFAVDASSRLELEPGVKDPERVVAFIRAVRAQDPGESSSDGNAQGL